MHLIRLYCSHTGEIHFLQQQNHRCETNKLRKIVFFFLFFQFACIFLFASLEKKKTKTNGHPYFQKPLLVIDLHFNQFNSTPEFYTFKTNAMCHEGEKNEAVRKSLRYRSEFSLT